MPGAVLDMSLNEVLGVALAVTAGFVGLLMLCASMVPHCGHKESAGKLALQPHANGRNVPQPRGNGIQANAGGNRGPPQHNQQNQGNFQQKQGKHGGKGKPPQGNQAPKLGMGNVMPAARFNPAPGQDRAGLHMYNFHNNAFFDMPGLIPQPPLQEVELHRSYCICCQAIIYTRLPGKCDVCLRLKCREHGHGVVLATQCTKQLRCRHRCYGDASDSPCLPCFRPSCHVASLRVDASLSKDCSVCLSPLTEQPVMQLSCRHMFHVNCLRQMIAKGHEASPVLAFNFLNCPECRTRMNHRLLRAVMETPLQREASWNAKAQQHLAREGHTVSPQYQAMGEHRAGEFALTVLGYEYYQCYKCKEPYFGGQGCRAAGDGVDAVGFKRSNLICPSCMCSTGKTTCPKHGTEHIVYKCRYCCSIASWVCTLGQGTTHFCEGCHSQHPTVERMRTNGTLPPCPVAPQGVRATGDCPLGVPHPPPGTEFSLGCSACRHEHGV